MTKVEGGFELKDLNLTQENFFVRKKTIGGYNITGNSEIENSIILMMTRKPSLFHRMCTKLFLGWTWVDGEVKKEVKQLLKG